MWIPRISATSWVVNFELAIFVRHHEPRKGRSRFMILAEKAGQITCTYFR